MHSRYVILFSYLLLATASQSAPAAACLKSQSGVCIECDTSKFYYLQYGACQSYQGLHCLAIDHFGNCKECDSGFLLSDSGVCIYVQDRVLNCAEYTDTNGYVQCVRCSPGFLLARLQCLPETAHCRTYYPGRNRCKVCEEGFELSGNRFDCDSVESKTATN